MTLRPIAVPVRRLLPLALLLAVCSANSSVPGQRSGDPCTGRTVRAFAMSLARSTGGAPSPREAAEVQSGRSGWHVELEAYDGTTLVAAQATRHVVQGPDRTWQVDAGQDC